MEIKNRRKKPPIEHLPKACYASPKIPPQQFPMPLAFLYNLKPIIAHEIDQPLAGDILKVMCFRNLKPAVFDPSADGLVLVAEDGFHVLGREGVGQIVPRIVELGAEVCENLLGMEVVLICLICLDGFPHTGILGGEGDGDKIFFGMLGAVFYVFVKVTSPDDVTVRFLAGVLAGDHAVLEHPRTLAFADMQDFADFLRVEELGFLRFTRHVRCAPSAVSAMQFHHRWWLRGIRSDRFC